MCFTPKSDVLESLNNMRLEDRSGVHNDGLKPWMETQFRFLILLSGTACSVFRASRVFVAFYVCVYVCVLGTGWK